VPWDLILGLWRDIKDNSQTSVDEFTRKIVARVSPPPAYEGELPESPRFVLAANHYQRKGLWILHTAAVLTRAVRDRYGPGDPPVRWMVTANWPPWRIGPWMIPSPGDWLLPKVAHALHCYPVSFSGANPAFTARSIRKLMKDSQLMSRPVGIFPEGVAGAAGQVGGALPGVGRLLAMLELPVVPAGVSENGRFVVRFGASIPPAELASSPDPAALVMRRIRDLL
jgi:hypothetical protein